MLFGAFLGPIAAILIFNSIVFVIVARTAIKHRRKTAKGASAIGLIVRLIGVMILLGLTWVFGGLTVVRETSLAFQILFAIFNSSQGFFLFLFFCVLNKDAREAWKKILLRGRYKQSLPSSSHPASRITGKYPQISSSGTRSTSQNTTIKNSVLQEQSTNQVSSVAEMSAIEEEDKNPVSEVSAREESVGNEIASDQISTGAEIGAFGEVYENPVTEISAIEGTLDNRFTAEGSDQISTGAEIGAIEVHENPVAEISAIERTVGNGIEGSDQVSTCSEVAEISFAVENPEVSTRDTSPESGVKGNTVIENHHADHNDPSNNHEPGTQSPSA